MNIEHELKTVSIGNFNDISIIMGPINFVVSENHHFRFESLHVDIIDDSIHAVLIDEWSIDIHHSGRWLRKKNKNELWSAKHKL